MGLTKNMLTHLTERCNKLNESEKSKVVREGTAWIDDRVITRIKKRLDEVKSAREAYHVYEDPSESDSLAESAASEGEDDDLTSGDFNFFEPGSDSGDSECVPADIAFVGQVDNVSTQAVISDSDLSEILASHTTEECL